MKKSLTKFCQILNRPSKICQRILKKFLSGEILAKLLNSITVCIRKYKLVFLSVSVDMVSWRVEPQKQVHFRYCAWLNDNLTTAMHGISLPILVPDLKDRCPPFRCPVEGCSYQTKHKPDWARHYGSVHQVKSCLVLIT